MSELQSTVYELAAEIRRVDGNHTLGAAALAEALLPFIIDRLAGALASTGEGESSESGTPEVDAVQQKAPATLKARGIGFTALGAWLSEVFDLARRLERERDEARANYRFMVERAADQKLDGYRELGQRAANAENEADALRAKLAAIQEDKG